MLPYALTRDVPVLLLTGASTTYEDDALYLELDFSRGWGTHDETGLCFCRALPADPPENDRQPEYMVGVNSSGNWVYGGVLFCGMSHRWLYFEWQRYAAAELALPRSPSSSCASATMRRQPSGGL